MIANAEFRRNVWLELTPHRLVSVPLVLFALLLVAYVSDPGPFLTAHSFAAFGSMALFAVAVGGWGSLSCAQGVTSEIRARTWDNQRLLPLSPWSLTWGKLFGTTVAPWYVGLWCLAIYLCVPLKPFAERLEYAGLAVLCVFWLHAVALLIPFADLESASGSSSVRSLAGGGGIVLGSFLLTPVLPAFFGTLKQPAYTWYQYSWDIEVFWVVSLVFFTGWAILGIQRCMRGQLGLRNGPWLWLAFTAVIMAYVPGLPAQAKLRPELPPAPPLAVSSLLLACAIGWLLTYGTALGETKDALLLRRLQQCLRERSWRRLGEELPAWSLSLLVTLVAFVVLLVQQLRADPVEEGPTVYFSVSALAFALRDLCLLLALALGSHTKRARAAAVLYSALLYGVVGLLSAMLELPGGPSLFWPMPDATFAHALPALVQLGIAAAWLHQRARAVLRSAV